jgi:hypothetical protein
MVITRAAAIEQGFTTYLTGPCKAGHMCGRYLDGGCLDCSRLYAQGRGGRTDEERARDAAAARERREAKAEEGAAAKVAKAAERERVKAERERAREQAKAERRYEPRAASPKLTDDERAAIDQAKAARLAAKAERERQAAERRAERERQATERSRRTEQVRAEQARRQELATERARQLEEMRQKKQQEVEEAKAAGKPHRNVARHERHLARAQVTAARRATGTAAPSGFDANEQAAIEAALAAGKRTRIEQGEWDKREAEPKRRW